MDDTWGIQQNLWGASTKQRLRSIELESTRAQLTQEWVFAAISAVLFKPVSERPGRTLTYKLCMILKRHRLKLCTLGSGTN